MTAKLAPISITSRVPQRLVARLEADFRGGGWQAYVKAGVAEAVRISGLVSPSPVVVPYTWYRYHSEPAPDPHALELLTSKDAELVSTNALSLTDSLSLTSKCRRGVGVQAAAVPAGGQAGDHLGRRAQQRNEGGRPEGLVRKERRRLRRA